MEEKISESKFEELISKIETMYEATYMIYIGNLDDDEIVKMYEFDADLEIAKESSLIFEGYFYDDVIEVRPYMHHEVDYEEAWNWLLEGGLKEELSDKIEYDEDFDYNKASVDEIIEHLHITNE